MDKLLERQTELHHAICRSYENLKKKGPPTHGAIQSRLQLLNHKWEEFQSNHRAILSSRPQASADVDYFKLNLYAATEDRYCDEQAKFYDARRALEDAASATKTSSSSRAEPQLATSVHPTKRELPRIDLPKFSGNHLEWIEFRDLFSALVKDDVAISQVEKLNYLKMSLTGEPSLLLRNIPVSGDNFARAWSVLVDRYDNPRLIISAYLDRLFGLPALKAESATALKQLFDGTTDAIGALETLGRPVQHWGDMLVYMTAQRLDTRTRSDWRRSLGDKKSPPTFQELSTFLKARIGSLEDHHHSEFIATIAGGPPDVRSPSRGMSRRSSANPPTVKAHNVSSRSNSGHRCSYCQQSHYIVACDAFRAKAPAERRQLVDAKHLCVNCLGAHNLAQCKSSKTCMGCGQRHHTLLHDTFSIASGPSGISAPLLPHSTHTVQALSNRAVLLATALVTAHSGHGTRTLARALIDPCSEVSFASESLVRRLHLPRKRIPVPVTGIGATASSARGVATLHIASRLDPAFQLKVSTLILPRLTSYRPQCRAPMREWPHLQGLPLADPDFASNDVVDLLLGADVFPAIIAPGIARGAPGSPLGQQTTLGWILTCSHTSFSSMREPDKARPSLVAALDGRSHTAGGDLHAMLERFWELESVPERPPASLLSPADQQCEEHFRSTHQRRADGRYIVRLAFQEPPDSLGGTHAAASHALLRMEGRFASDPVLRQLYSAFMGEYEELGHMRRLDNPGVATTSPIYLPHHGVLRGDSKIRVVFNGSARSSSGRSLNQVLHTGAALQPNLYDVLLRWRTHRYVCSADIEKMYRQILVHPADRDHQRILWRVRPSDPISEYQLCTVTYGLSIAPFLALRVLRQLAVDESSRFPRGVAVLTSNCYVDDVLFGGEDIESTLALQQEVIDLLMAGGFPLRKWTSNHPRLLSSLPAEWLASSGTLTWHQGSEHRLLGLSWSPGSDSFSFSPRAVALPAHLTKRVILSQIARLFDPLGLLSPITVRSKILMQTLWASKLHWDSPVPADVYSRWRSIHEDFLQLPSLQFRRWIGVTTARRLLELHGFADASDAAYAAAVYVRVVSADSQVSTTLLCAKTKVAPLKRITIPRLELCSLVLLCRLLESVRSALSMPFDSLHLWSDSMVALAWIACPPNRWQPFVANRVSLIQTTLPDLHWHHIAGTENPADLATRGVSAAHLRRSPSWQQGPPFLRAHADPWPQMTTEVHPEACPEKRVSAHAAHIAREEEPWDLIHRFSSLQRLLRVTAWCLRFVRNLRARRCSSPLFLQRWTTPTELRDAERQWTSLVQRSAFPDELSALQHQRPVSSRSSLLRLAPHLDFAGLLRVGGRLRHAHLSPDEAHPLLLPETSPFSELLVLDRHLRTLHGGVQLTLSTVRRTHWVVNGRRLVKKIISRCLPCIRQRASATQPRMGDLPPERVRPSRPFLHSGLDYGGPVKLRTSPGRGHRSVKGYIALFVCLATKAVHLEAVSGYSTDHFLAAFRRFISRRGLCATIRSDCGTNFVGADAELRALFTQGTEQFRHLAHVLARDQVTWRFNPPSAPHFGGIWEAGIKSTKHHLRRVLGDSTLTFEEMSTLLAQIEACLNSRPLVPLRDDPEDLDALTPGHFLIGSPLTAVPEPTLEDTPSSRLSRWQLLCQMRDCFWRRWSSEYLHTLTTRSKWHRDSPPLKVGDLALIRGELLPPTKWPLARVIATHPGSDGRVRVVTLRTASATMRRPVCKLCPLPSAFVDHDEAGGNVRIKATDMTDP